MHLLTIFCLFLTGFTPNEPPVKGDMYIQVNNIEDAKGTLFVAIYQGQESFLDEKKAILLITEKVNTGNQQDIKVSGLPFGEYAFAVFQDLNDNQELDTNIMGIPKEPFSFSGIPESKFREPYYAEVKFDFKNDGQKKSTSLSTFW